MAFFMNTFNKMLSREDMAQQLTASQLRLTSRIREKEKNFTFLTFILSELISIDS